MLLNLHSAELNKIKKRLGLSFIGYENYNGNYQLKVVKNGVTDYFKLTGTPADVTNARYLELSKTIENYYGQN